MYNRAPGGDCYGWITFANNISFVYKSRVAGFLAWICVADYAYGDWHNGYLYVGIIQTVLAGAIMASLPLWKKASVRALGFEDGEKITSDSSESSNAMPKGESHPLSMREIFALPGAKEVMLAFFCYCGLEQTSFLWVSSYINMHLGIAAVFRPYSKAHIYFPVSRVYPCTIGSDGSYARAFMQKAYTKK